MRYTIFLLVFLYAFVGCSEDNANSDTIFVNFGEEFELEVKQKAVVTGNALSEVTDSVLVEIVSLQDGRCPGVCIRAGEVQMWITVSSRQQTVSIPTCIGVDCGLVDEAFRNSERPTEIDTTNFSLSGKSYSILFKGATPHPKINGNKKIKGADRAILEVIRRK